MAQSREKIDLEALIRSRVLFRGRFLSGGGIVEACAFLGDKQKSASVRYRLSNRTLVCWLGGGFYLFWVIVGLILGPGMTFGLIIPCWGQGPSFRMPIGGLVLSIIFTIIGWLTCLQSVLGRRHVTFDFGRGIIVFSSRLVMRWEQIIRVSEVQKFVASSIVRPQGNPIASRYVVNVEPVSCYFFGLILKDGSIIRVLETTQREVVQQITRIVGEQIPTQMEPLGVADNPPPALRRWGKVMPLLALCVAVGGAFIVAVSGYEIWRSHLAQYWPTTQGTILESRAWSDRSAHIDRTGRTYINLSTQVKVTYHYCVNGRDYRSSVVSFDNHQRTQMPARYPVGSLVGVFYNPADPAEAVLDSSIGFDTEVLLVIGSSIAVAYGIYVWKLPMRRDVAVQM